MADNSSTPRKLEPTDVSNIEFVRDYLVREVGRLQFYPPDCFFNTILPRVTDDELCRVKSELKINDSTAWITHAMEGGMGATDHTKSDEPAVFPRVSAIFNNVANAVAVLGLGVPLVRLMDGPARTPGGETVHKTQPDTSCFVLVQTQKPCHCDPEVDQLHWNGKPEKPSNVSWVDTVGTVVYKNSSNAANIKDVSLILHLSSLLLTKGHNRMLGRQYSTSVRSWPMILVVKQPLLSHTKTN
jgi:hypothetical protein